MEKIKLSERRPTIPMRYFVITSGGKKATYQYTGTNMSMITMLENYEYWVEDPDDTPELIPIKFPD